MSGTSALAQPLERGAAARTAIDPARAAWALAIPCAALASAAVLLLGPPLSHVLFPARPPFALLSQTSVAPEPLEQTRYLIALLAPLLLSAATVAVVRRGLTRGGAGVAAAVAQLLAVALLVACVVGQHAARFQRVYFTLPTWIAGAALAALAVALARAPWIRVRAAALLRDGRWLRAAALAVAVLATVAWMLPAINSAHSVAWSQDPYDPAFQYDEAFAVLNGLTPLVDFTPQYGSLWSSLAALALLAFGKTLLVFTLALTIASVLALLAVYGVLRRAARSPLAGLALFLPFLATSGFLVAGTPLVRFSFATYFPMFPLRYGGAYLVAWLAARRLERGGGGRAWPLLLAAGLVAFNNTDFGVPAFAAALAALAWSGGPWDRRAALRLAGDAAIGLLGAFALVSLLTLVRAGALPELGRLTTFARIYAVGGFTLLPLPSLLGLPFAIFLTYAGAICAATVCALRRERNRVLTGMLAWAGVFGLGSAGYYVGRTDPNTLQATFSAWTLALALLAIVALRHVATAPWRRVSVAALAVLVGVGVAACSLAQTPLPWQQLARIDHRPAGVRLTPVDSPYVAPADPATRRFVSAIADGRDRFVLVPHAPVALFGTTGHVLADAYGLRDIVPFTGIDSLHTAEQLDEALAALRRAGGDTVLIPPFGESVVYRALARRGFELLTQRGLLRFPPDGDIGSVDGVVTVAGLTKWVDMRDLHPRALP